MRRGVFLIAAFLALPDIAAAQPIKRPGWSAPGVHGASRICNCCPSRHSSIIYLTNLYTPYPGNPYVPILTRLSVPYMNPTVPYRPIVFSNPYMPNVPVGYSNPYVPSSSPAYSSPIARPGAQTPLSVPLEVGPLQWPLGLRILAPATKTKTLRDTLDVLVPLVAAQAALGQPTPSQLEQALEAVRDFRKLLRPREGTMAEVTYTDSMRFLDRLERGLTALQGTSAQTGN
jgi:hypothetical protein